VDLKPGGMELWNRNMDQTVDKPGRHGTFQDLIAEGSSVGFELVRSEIVRKWGDVEVEIGLIVMRRAEPSEPTWRRAVRTLRTGGRTLAGKTG
jgi:hypothetical protein